MSEQNGKRSRKKQIEVDFIIEAPQAREIVVAGDFNGWSVTATPNRFGSSNSVIETKPLCVGG
jgi:1,4-alpha-glucan branching enzyme